MGAPSPSLPWAPIGMSWFIFDSQTPKREGSWGGFSGNHQPWAAITIQGGTTGVTLALSLHFPSQFSTQTHCPSSMPCDLAVPGLISTTGSGSILRSQGMLRCSVWK